MSAPSIPASRLQRILNGVERAGNALPHPATLFAGLAALVVLLSGLCHRLGVQVTNPANGAVVSVVNLLSAEGIQRMIVELPRNFLAYPPLGISLTCMLGIGILIATMLPYSMGLPDRLDRPADGVDCRRGADGAGRTTLPDEMIPA